MHAWIAGLDGPGLAGQDVLDPAERDRAASYLRPLDGARFAASRAFSRLILARYTGCPPGQLRFGVGSGGQPRLAGCGLAFSLARSGGLALLAVARGPVGADLERAVPRGGLADLAAARFSAAETACIERGCGGSPAAGFYRHWTAKEACLKAAGTGLAGGLRDTELTCGPAPVIRQSGRPLAGWRVWLADPAPGYRSAIVAAAPAAAVTWRRLAGPAPSSPEQEFVPSAR